jgi:hypothetical protein
LIDIFSNARLDQLAEKIVDAQLAQFDSDELLALAEHMGIDLNSDPKEQSKPAVGPGAGGET